MNSIPTSALPRTKFEVTGYVPVGGILSHLGRHQWLDHVDNSPIVAILKDGGGAATFTLDRTIEHSQEYRITVSVTPDPARPRWVIPVVIPCYGRRGILDQIAEGWEPGRGEVMKARSIQFPGLDRMDDHLEQKPAAPAWGMCQVIIAAIEPQPGTFHANLPHGHSH